MDGPIKGRGALSNAAGRFARHEREPDRDALGRSGGSQWRRPAAAGDDTARRYSAQHHRAQPLSGPAVRPIDQSISRLRARLHLLLRARHSLLPRSVAGAGLRDADLLQTECARVVARRAGRARLHREPDRARHEYGSLPARRARAARDAKHSRAAARAETSADDSDERLADTPRSRCAHRARAPRSRGRQRQPHDARPRLEAAHGAANGGSRSSACT